MACKMAGTGSAFLSLPPCLRQRAFLSANGLLPASSLPFPEPRLQTRPFTWTSTRYTTQSGSKPRKSLKKATAAASKTPKIELVDSKRVKSNSPGEKKEGFRIPPSMPETKPYRSEGMIKVTGTPHGSEEGYGLRLLDYNDGKGTMIYEAPSHGTFFTLSYMTGLMMQFYAWNSGSMIFAMPASVYLKVPTMVVCTLVASAGALLWLGPSKLVRTITVVPRTRVSEQGTETTEPVLQIQARAMIPFYKQKPFEVHLSEVALDRKVVATSIGAVDIPVSDVVAWSNREAAYKPLTFKEKVARFNRSLVNVVPAFLRDLRRVARREGMAYMNVAGRGTWKLDLQGARVLDNGNALARLVAEEIPAHETAWYRIRKNILGIQ